MIYVFEDTCHTQLNPLAMTRPVMAIRSGRSTFLERIESFTEGAEICLVVRPEMERITRELYPEMTVNPTTFQDGFWLKAAVFWDSSLLKRIFASQTLFLHADRLMAGYLPAAVATDWMAKGGPLSGVIPPGPSETCPVPDVEYLWEIQPRAEAELKDMEINNPVVKREGVTVIHPDQVDISGSATLLPQIVIDASDGPVILEENVTIHPFSYIQGPTVIGRGSTVTAHTRITKSFIGPGCKVGGEISSTIFQGWSNKVHYGFIGNSFIGEWVNLGAGTTGSNLKNNYSTVTVRVNNTPVNTGEQFIGAFIGDHVKSAIGTRFNTGTVIEPGCNLVDQAFLPKWIPAFTWLQNGNLSTYDWEKFLVTAEAGMQRRKQHLTAAQQQLLHEIRGRRTSRIIV
ncbi:MAG: putative sugar nucleotidyl transferase [Fidelibacterota bacterium]